MLIDRDDLAVDCSHPEHGDGDLQIKRRMSAKKQINLYKVA
jgi:hypothetical protein